MKNVSSALAAFLPSTRQFFEADLFTIAPGSPQNFLKWSQRMELSPWAGTAQLVAIPTAVGLAGTDPNGGNTAAAITYTASAGSLFNDWVQDVGLLPCADMVYTFSVWVRVASGTASFSLNSRDVSPINQQFHSATFTATTTWKRFPLPWKFVADGSTGVHVAITSLPANPGITLLVWGAQLEMRGSAGPYVATLATAKWGSTGPLPELVRVTTCDQDITWQGNTYISGSAQNLLRFSQDLEAPGAVGWNGGGTGGTPTITADATADPQGNANAADQINYPAATAGQESYVSQDSGFVPVVGKSYTFSVWLKAGTLSTAYIRLVQSTGENSTFSAALALTGAWQRFSVTITPTSVGTGDLLVRINNTNFTGSASAGNFFAYGAQLEQSDTVGRYIPTYAIPQYGTGKISRGNLTWAVGATVDTLDLDYDAPQLASQVTLGFLDGARVQLNRLYGSAFGSWVDSVTLFAGNVAPIDKIGRTRITLRLRSRTDLLNNSVPRNLYQPSCEWSLFDAGCTLNKLSFAVSGTVTSGSTAFQTNSALGQAAGYFEQGTLVFLTGINAGLCVTVKKFASGNFTPFAPLPFAPATGDTFIAFPGCDKSAATCTSKFSNLINFKGEPYVPAPEASF